ncbi:hypothetical protein H1P_3050010 [Hyella patelloides LEGE 07179]|uniref:Uncharacterized protein n=1 Tax=Hyella patelloides LEGE 07179 TaxID=945734 RepID=A0A563VUJ6_9CYAN|nr:hypothetical protein H1P_3050010 [Hyella patelloides LEGE 07179]
MNLLLSYLICFWSHKLYRNAIYLEKSTGKDEKLDMKKSAKNLISCYSLASVKLFKFAPQNQ